MKNLIIALFIVGSVTNTLAQDQFFETKITKDKVPPVILKSLAEDFPGSVYQDFKAIPLKFFKNDVAINNDQDPNLDYNTYQIYVVGNNKKITATYDESGKLLGTDEIAHKEALPVDIDKSIAEAYPGWIVKNDVYKMTHYRGRKPKEQYKIILEKGAKKMKIYIDGNGKVLNDLIRSPKTS
ncbi:hypothetical protein [Yeosuana marina]|uniref:hypothetical protein n=1 Tax=Yeosuana marina TaxID=1565536 RepID=UPI0030C7AAF4